MQHAVQIWWSEAKGRAHRSPEGCSCAMEGALSWELAGTWSIWGLPKEAAISQGGHPFVD